MIVQLMGGVKLMKQAAVYNALKINDTKIRTVILNELFKRLYLITIY